MKDFIISLIQNIALLLSFSMLYEYYWIKLDHKSISSKIITGLVLSIIVSIIMFTPFKLTETIVFDVRSVLLSISGLFFGLVPTLITALTAILIRIYLGGDGMYMGIAVISSASAIGLLWHYYRPDWKDKNFKYELIFLGIAVHFAMALCTSFLPSGKEIAVLKNISIPLIIVYIPGTWLLGYFMVKQYQSYQNRKAKEKWIETEFKFQQLMKSSNIYTLIASPEGNIIFGNEHFKQVFDLKEALYNDHTFSDLLFHKLDDENEKKLLTFKNSSINGCEIYAILNKNEEENNFINWYLTKTFDFNGKFSGYIIIGVDLTELIKTEEQLKERNQELLSQYEMYKELNQKLTEANKIAEESSNLKSMLLSNLSHEVRTPMNAILGFSEILKKELPDEKRAQYTDIIYKSSHQLMQSIDDIVLISKLQSKNIALNTSRVFPSMVLNELILLHHGKGNNQNIEFKVTYEKKLENLQIITDSARLKQILVYLLNNSYNYTPTGKIEIGFYTESANIIFYVKDNGLGIDAEEQKYIFDTFYRGSAAKTFAIRGLGLGLSIVKELAKLLKGDIWLDSEKGKGSCFYIKFPVEIIEDSEVIKESILQNELEDIKKYQILVVEDEYMNYQFLETILNPLVKKIDYAQNGYIAVEKAKMNHYDFILMDIRMPVMNGIEATKAIKKNKPDLPVIALTAFNDEQTKAESLKAGCDTFMIKPVYLQNLINTFIELSKKT